MVETPWTPRRGIVRAAVLGFVVAVALAILLTPVAVLAPALLLNAIFRALVTFGIGWMLCGAVHSAAGMTGGLVTFLGVFYAALVMLSNHVVWALFGVPLGPQGEVVTGWHQVFDPSLVGLLSLFVVVPLGFCFVLCRDGVPGPDFFWYVSTLGVWGNRRS